MIQTGFEHVLISLINMFKYTILKQALNLLQIRQRYRNQTPFSESGSLCLNSEGISHLRRAHSEVSFNAA
jgi:hypothetical protein